MCGCQEYLFDDQAHTLQHKWRSPQQLQTLAISGRFGRQPGALRPFDLRVKELRSELEARGVVLDSKMLRADLQLKLNPLSSHQVKPDQSAFTSLTAALLRRRNLELSYEEWQFSCTSY